MQILIALVLSAFIFVVEAAPPVTQITQIPPTLEPPTLPPTLPPPTTRPTFTVVDPTFTIIDPTPTIGPVRPTQCICPGRLYCCKALVDSEDPAAQQPLNDLGVVIDGTHIPVGISCVPYNPLTAQAVCREPVCCFDTRKPEIAAIGCVKVNNVIGPTIGPTIFDPTFVPFPTLVDA